MTLNFQERHEQLFRSSPGTLEQRWMLPQCVVLQMHSNSQHRCIQRTDPDILVYYVISHNCDRSGLAPGCKSGVRQSGCQIKSLHSFRCHRTQNNLSATILASTARIGLLQIKIYDSLENLVTNKSLLTSFNKTLVIFNGIYRKC